MAALAFALRASDLTASHFLSTESSASWYRHQPRPPRWRRQPAVRCAAVAELCKQRFSCTPEEARVVEEKLPAEPWFDLTTANSRCDALQDRLSLSDLELQNVVMARPAVLGLS